MTRAALAIALTIAGGCRTRPFNAPLGASDGGGSDAQPNGCAAHAYQAVPLVALDALSTASPLMGQSARALATVSLRPCDVLADFTVDVQPGNATDFVTLTAHAWIGSRDCGAASRVARPVELEPAAFNQFVSVRDGAPGGTAALSIRVAPPSSSDCTARPLFGACDGTCQCTQGDPAVHCLPSGGGAICARPCAEDVECGGGLGCAPMLPSGALFACSPPAAECCPQTCGVGQACNRQTCVCIISSTPASGPCACDLDCAAGALCNAAVQHCFNPCSSVADCPGPDAAACDHGICSYFVN